jgi:hypothetical protein
MDEIDVGMPDDEFEAFCNLDDSLQSMVVLMWRK